MFRSWCLKPSRSQETLERRYDVIQFFLDPNQHELLRTLRDHLKPIVNIPVNSSSKKRKQTKNEIISLILGCHSKSFRSKHENICLETNYRNKRQ